MNKIILSILLVFSCLCLYAQTNLDSLYTVWEDETLPDSSRIEAFRGYIWKGFLFNKPDSAFILAETLLDYSESEQFPKGKAIAYSIQGISFAIKGDNAKTLDYFQRSLKISKEIGDKAAIGSSLGNIGGVYYNQSDYVKALDYNLQTAKILEEIGNKNGLGNALNNIGNIYTIQGNYPKAIENFEQSLRLHTEIGDQRRIADALRNIGSVHTKQGDYEKALDYNERSLKLREEIGDLSGIPTSLGNIGTIYKNQRDYTKALEYHQRSLKISHEIGNKMEIAISQGAIGDIFIEQGSYKKAVVECQKSLELSKEIGAIILQKNACACLYKANKGLGKDKAALIYYEEEQVLEDSLHAQETSAKLQQMEFAKQVLADSLATVEVARKIEVAHQNEIQQKEKTRNISYGIGALVLLIAVGLYSRLRYVRKSKAIIEKEKDRSNNLLLNILPADIAEELKIHGKAEARDFDMVSILFTDFKGFTRASALLTAQDLVSEINTCFEAFDGIMEKYGIEKIKTIGDAYMAAGGLPVPTDDSIKNTVLAALEMQAFITNRKVEMDNKGLPAFEMRVGIHTGPVVAGIVGVKKFQYDIWGDTVNTAARMESAGEVARVNISQATYEFLKEDSQFAFESRGKVEAKGKGEIHMYYVMLGA